MSKNFPKEGVKRLKEAIQIMKGELRQKEKEIEFLKRELQNITKTTRERKRQVDKKEVEYEDWRKDFLKRFKKAVE